MAKTDIYRGGKVHVLDEMCSTCIFNPHTRPVSGARVAELVTATKDEQAATVPCHTTLYGMTDIPAAICRGWWDRLADRDPVLLMAQAMGVVEYDTLPEDDDTKETSDA